MTAKKTDFNREIEKQMSRRIGKNLRQLRLKHGLSQSDLGTIFNLSFQQIQKYEKGVNRFHFEKAIFLTEQLKIPVADLTDGLDDLSQSHDLTDIPVPSEAQQKRINKIVSALPSMPIPFLDMIVSICDICKQYAIEARKLERIKA